MYKYYLVIKRGNLAICEHMDGPWGHSAMWSKSYRERPIWSHPYVGSLKKKKEIKNWKTELIDTQNRLAVARGRG